MSERGYACITDSFSNVYLAGFTNSTNNITSGGFQDTIGSSYNYDAFLVKFSISGSRLWTTYYGGTGEDEAYSCCIDQFNNIYIAGSTHSTNGITSGGFQDTIINFYAGDAFLVKFNAAGIRLWGIYYGGNNGEEGFSCATDSSNNVFLAGYTSSTSGIALNGFQNTYGGNGTSIGDAFLVKFNAEGIRLWGTYYGGNDGDYGFDCVTDHSGNVYLAGTTSSTSGIASGGFQNTWGGGNESGGDAFLVKFNTGGNRIWATYYGGIKGEFGPSCAIDNVNNVYMSGNTLLNSGIAINGFKNVYGGSVDGNAFLVKFSSSGSRIWGTYYGDRNGNISSDCTVDGNNNVYIAGYTYNQYLTNIVPSGGFQNIYVGGTIDGFIAKFNSTGNRLWGTFYGGNSNDNLYSVVISITGNVFTAGETWSTTGISNAGFQNNYGGGQYYGDAYLAKIDGGKTFKTICPNSSESITSNFIGSSYQWQIDSRSGFINLTDTIYYTGLTTKTLRFNNLPSSFYDYQYRCFVNGDYTEPFQLRFATNWSGTVNSAWESPTNWSCGSLPDGNTDVIIETGPVILNSNGICRTFTVKPGVSFTVTTGNTLNITH